MLKVSLAQGRCPRDFQGGPHGFQSTPHEAQGGPGVPTWREKPEHFRPVFFWQHPRRAGRLNIGKFMLGVTLRAVAPFVDPNVELALEARDNGSGKLIAYYSAFGLERTDAAEARGWDSGRMVGRMTKVLDKCSSGLAGKLTGGTGAPPGDHGAAVDAGPGNLLGAFAGAGGQVGSEADLLAEAEASRWRACLGGAPGSLRERLDTLDALCTQMARAPCRICGGAGPAMPAQAPAPRPAKRPRVAPPS